MRLTPIARRCVLLQPALARLRLPDLAPLQPAVLCPCREAYKWVKDRRPQIAITKDDAQRLQEAEVQVSGLVAAALWAGVAAAARRSWWLPGKRSCWPVAQHATSVSQLWHALRPGLR